MSEFNNLITIKQLYCHLIEDDNIVYIAYSEYLIFAKKYEDTIINCNNTNDNTYAQYEADKLQINTIINKFITEIKINTILINNINYKSGDIIKQSKFYKHINAAFAINITKNIAKKYKLSGYLRQYNYNGLIFTEGNITDGYDNGIWKYYRNGILFKEINYVNNKALLWTYYYKSGYIYEQGTIDNNLKDGLWVSYYDGCNREISCYGMFKKGERKGEWIYNPSNKYKKQIKQY